MQLTRPVIADVARAVYDAWTDAHHNRMDDDYDAEYPLSLVVPVVGNWFVCDGLPDFGDDENFACYGAATVARYSQPTRRAARAVARDLIEQAHVAFQRPAVLPNAAALRVGDFVVSVSATDATAFFVAWSRPGLMLLSRADGSFLEGLQFLTSPARLDRREPDAMFEYVYLAR